MGFATKETWFPDINQTARITLSEGLSPLARHQSDITVVQGCLTSSATKPTGAAFLAHRCQSLLRPRPGMANSISTDQVVARHLERTPALAHSTQPLRTPRHGPGMSLAWDQRGKPVAGQDDPVQVFHKLFSADDLPLEQPSCHRREPQRPRPVLSEPARPARSPDRHRQA